MKSTFLAIAFACAFFWVTPGYCVEQPSEEVILKELQLAPLLGEKIGDFKERAAKAIKPVDEQDEGLIRSYKYSRVFGPELLAKYPNYKETLQLKTINGVVMEATIKLMTKSPKSDLPVIAPTVAAFVSLNDADLMNDVEESRNLGFSLGKIFRELTDKTQSVPFDYPHASNSVTISHADGVFTIDLSPKLDAKKKSPNAFTEKATSENAADSKTTEASEQKHVSTNKEYITGLMAKIGRRLAPEDGGKDFEVAVKFKVQRDGSLTDASIDKSSNIPEVDKALVEAVEKASPYSPLPPDNASFVELVFVMKKNGPIRNMDLKPTKP